MLDNIDRGADELSTARLAAVPDRQVPESPPALAAVKDAG
jgi:hypothetical protein